MDTTPKTHFDGQLYYDVNNEQHTLSVVGAKASLRNIVVPDTVEIDGTTCEVIEIAAHAFEYHKLKSVVVGNNVDRVGRHAFHNCTNLTKVILGNHLIELAFGAFYGCVNLTKVNLPESLHSIGPYAFFCCLRLNDIYSDIQDPSQCKIGKFAFGCEDELYQRVYLHVPDSITIYKEQTEWGRFAQILSNNPTQPQPNHIIGEKEDILIDVYDARYSLDGKTLLFVPKGTPSYEIIKGCETIAKEAFKGTLVEKVTVPDTVTTIGNSAFENCKNLYTITLPDSVKELGHSTFLGCERLTAVRLPRYIDGIHIHTFYGCKKLTSIYLPSGLQFIGLGGFENCSALKSIVIPHMAGIGSFAFAGCSSLRDVSLPQWINQEAIETELFEGCSSLVKVHYPYDFIPERMFANCESLDTIEIAGILHYVDDSAFCCTNLRRVDFRCPVSDDMDTFENFWRFSNQNHDIEFLIPFGSEGSFSKLFDLADQNPKIKITVKPESKKG